MHKIKDKFIFIALLFIFIPLPVSLSANSSSFFISPLAKERKDHEVFGFAPYWNIDKLDNIQFNVLTTLAYFDIPVDGDGNFDIEGIGYQTFIADKATELFKKAHKNGTRVVLTITQMNNSDIQALMDNQEAQEKLIQNVINLVKRRGIDGVNVDFEYIGDPGNVYRNKFSNFVGVFTKELHERISGSKLTVSVYASAVIDPKIYNIQKIAKSADGIFMMAYDFATTSSDNAIPTSPLYGHKEGKYWYDVSTAVEDFLKVMPPEKLILGVPWYGYNYPVYSPQVMAETYQGYYSYYWYKGRRYYNYYTIPSWSQTYSTVQNEVQAKSTGWDNYGQVGWKAYRDNGVWRMVFIEDVKSLRKKYDFAKNKNLGGVGMWAMGNDEGKHELWSLLEDEFGKKLVENQVLNKKINEAT